MRLIPVRAVVTVILFVATVACVAGAAFGNWRFGLPTHDKTTVISTVVTLGAFVLLAWGVVVALAAYISATGSPRLTVELRFRYSYPNKPVFMEAQKDPSNKSGKTYIEPYRQLEGDVLMENRSRYSARTRECGFTSTALVVSKNRTAGEPSAAKPWWMPGLCTGTAGRTT